MDDIGGGQVSGLNVERGGRLIIADLSFVLQPGEALLLTGPNGAGKTTLMRALAGLLPIKSGTIELEGASSDEGNFGEHCHYVGHTNAAKGELTVRENLRFWARFMGGDEASEKAAIAKVGLAALADIPVRYLSAGQQRRVAIARLLVVRRRVWLLDEPTVSLDAANTRRLVEFGNAHLASGGIIVAATHLPIGFVPAKELRLEPLADGGATSIWNTDPAEQGAIV